LRVWLNGLHFFTSIAFFDTVFWLIGQRILFAWRGLENTACTLLPRLHNSGLTGRHAGAPPRQGAGNADKYY